MFLHEERTCDAKASGCFSPTHGCWLIALISVSVPPCSCESTIASTTTHGKDCRYLTTKSTVCRKDRSESRLWDEVSRHVGLRRSVEPVHNPTWNCGHGGRCYFQHMRRWRRKGFKCLKRFGGRRCFPARMLRLLFLGRLDGLGSHRHWNESALMQRALSFLGALFIFSASATRERERERALHKSRVVPVLVLPKSFTWSSNSHQSTGAT